MAKGTVEERLTALEHWRAWVLGAAAVFVSVGGFSLIKSIAVIEKAENKAIVIINQRVEKSLKDIEEAKELVPVGTVLAFYGSTNSVPDRFLPCMGQTNLAQTNYPGLYAHLLKTKKGLVQTDRETFSLPDLRGMFLRGLDTRTGQDAVDKWSEDHNGGVRAIGEIQPDEVKEHAHKYSKSKGIDRHPFGEYANIHHDSDEQSTSDYGGKETRPVNVAVNFIIKY